MKRILIIIFLLVILGLFLLFFREPKTPTGFVTNMTFDVSDDILFVHETVKYPSNVSIVVIQNPSNVTIGITGDPWNINFGLLPLGVRGKRSINIANDKQPVFRIRLVCYGNICPMINFDKNDFILHRGEETKVTVTLDTSLSPSPGDYKGEIDIISDRPKISFISTILGW